MAIEINATTRKAQGTGASRRLRNTGRVPGVVYGAGDVNLIELDHNELYYKLRAEAFHASILSLNLDGKKESVLLRDFVMHPFRQQVQHIDFQRVDAKKKMHIKVPLHFINADIAPGVKEGGGKISHVLTRTGYHLPAQGSAGLHRSGSGTPGAGSFRARSRPEAARRRGSCRTRHPYSRSGSRCGASSARHDGSRSGCRG